MWIIQWREVVRDDYALWLLLKELKNEPYNKIVANITLSISNIFSLIHVKIIDKFEININKPKHEDEILSNTTETNENVKILLSDKEEELKKLRDREKIIREIITKEIININNLNSISNSEYFIVVPKLYTKLNKDSRKILFENNGFYQNSIFEYFQDQNFINLGKTWTPIYIKNRDELKKGFRKFDIFKKFVDSKVSTLIKKDNEIIRKKIYDKKDNDEIRAYFFDNREKLRFKEYLFFEFMIVSSLNLNEENITIFDEETKINFISKILSHQIQDIKLKEIMIGGGIKLFLNESFPNDVKKDLKNNSDLLLNKLEINNYLEKINRRDLDKALKEILKEKYKKEYADEIMRVYNLVKDF